MKMKLHNELPVYKATYDLLSIHRGGLYYKPVSISEENLSIFDFLDKQYLDTPFTVVENWLYNFKR